MNRVGRPFPPAISVSLSSSLTPPPLPSCSFSCTILLSHLFSVSQCISGSTLADEDDHGTIPGIDWLLCQLEGPYITAYKCAHGSRPWLYRLDMVTYCITVPSKSLHLGDNCKHHFFKYKCISIIRWNTIIEIKLWWYVNFVYICCNYSLEVGHTPGIGSKQAFKLFRFLENHITSQN